MIYKRIVINSFFLRIFCKSIERTSSRRNMSTPPIPNCLFCRIADDNVQTDTDLVFTNEEFVAFKDHKPAAQYHYLVVTRAHHGKINSLKKEDSEMISRMEDVGKYVLANQISGFDGVVDNVKIPDALMGFHWPMCLVGHLHMHAIYPAPSMSFLNRNVVFSQKFSFGTPDMAIEMLESKK
jgi:diadenosine tetraphosphate (Ap4A) HIT family hydrolase